MSEYALMGLIAWISFLQVTTVYIFYKHSQELDKIYTHVMRFTIYADDLLERIKSLSDRISKLEKKKASHEG